MSNFHTVDHVVFAHWDNLFSSFPPWKVSVLTAGCKHTVNMFMCLESRLDNHDKNTCSATKSRYCWFNKSSSLSLSLWTQDTRKVNERNTGVGTSSSEILFLWSFLSQRWAGPTVKEVAQLHWKKWLLLQQPVSPLLSCTDPDCSTWRGHAVCVVGVATGSFSMSSNKCEWESNWPCV